MREVIMRYSGSGEDSHGLERVGELVRCGECKHYNEDDWSCRVDGTGGWQPTDYCSAGQRKVGELIRCEDCRYNSNAHGNYVNCDIIPQMFGRTTDNYCSMGEKIHEEG